MLPLHWNHGGVGVTQDETQRAKDLFLDLLEESAEGCKQLLERARAESPSMAERAERLLAVHDQAEARVPRMLDAVREDVASELQSELQKGRAGAGTVLGDYLLEEEIASGASGVVYRARQQSLDRRVAVKILRSGRFAGSREVERFRAEAEAVARLDDPTIVPIYEVGESEAGPFFSMKWIEGRSLADALGDYVGQERRVAQLVLRVARAVHHAHQRGILHRDLKPGNILLDGDGTPFVADFGIAKRIDENDDATRTNWIAGTPAYMAPEQASISGDALSVTADVWALGAILYELLAGRPAFSGKTITEVLLRVRENEPDPLPAAVPRDLRTIVATCLSKEPARRYASANGLAIDLERWLGFEPILARRATTVERLVLLARRRPLVAGLTALVAVLVFALALGATWATVRLSDQVEQITLAETDARERLRASLLAQARARRQSVGANRRSDCLSLISQATEIRPGPELRDEAIACLAIPDVAVASQWTLLESHPRLAAFDGDLELIALATMDDGEILVLHTQDQSEVARLPGFGPTPWVVEYSADGRYLGVKYHGQSTSANPTFVLWDIEEQEEITRLPVLAEGIEFHPDGRTLVVAAPEGLIEIEVATGRELRRMEVEGSPFRFRFSPGGDRAALVCYPERTLRVFTWPERRELHFLESGKTLLALDWSADGRLLYGGSDYRAHLLDVDSGEVVRSFVGHLSDVTTADFSPVEDLLVTSSWDGTSRLWDTVTGEELIRVETGAKSFGRDGRLAFGADELAGIWDVNPQRVRRALHGHTGKAPDQVSFSADGALLASSGGGQVIVWESATGRRLAVLDIDGVRGCVFLPDGRLLTATPGVGIQSWELPADGAGWASELPRPNGTLLAGEFQRFSTTPDGRILCAHTRDRRIHVVWLDGSRPPLEVAAPVGALAPNVDPTGRWLASGNWRGREARVRVWDLESGEIVTDLCEDWGSLRIGFGPRGEHLLAGYGAQYRVFETGTWELLRTFQRPIGYDNAPAPMAFGPTDSVALLDTRQSVRLHRLSTGELLARFQPPDDVNAGVMAIDPTGRWLASASPNNRIELWDLPKVEGALAELGLESDEPWPFE